MKQVKYFIFFLLGVILQDNSTFGCPCCRQNSAIGYCYDWSQPTPCCGNRRCDANCCSCGGGCRTPRTRSLTFNAVSQDSGKTEFDQHDVNQDGTIDVEEAYKAVQSGIFGNYSGSLSEFKDQYYNKLDSDNDGNLTFNEIKNHDGIELWKLK